MPKRIYSHKDNASGQLNAGISAATTSVVLKSGEGASFPQPVNGSATSLGDSETLNSTGIQAAGVAVGDWIENVTDGSVALVVAVNTDDVTTTPLKGGSDNTWESSDVWRVNSFVATLIQYEADGVTIAQREQILVEGRSTDTLTVATRGYNSSGAKSFDADDYIYQFVVADSLEAIADVMGEILKFVESNEDEINNRISVDSSEIYGADSVGTDAYAVTLSPVPSSYTTGMVVNFKAGTANTGACSLNVNSLGAKSIKLADGSDPSNNDIIVGQIVTVVYDGTNFQMLSPIANLPPTEFKTTEYTMTLAKDTAGGHFVAMDTSGEVEPCAPTGNLAAGSTTDVATDSPENDDARRRIFRLSTTLILEVHNNNGGDLQINLITVDPTDGSISSVDTSLGAINLGTAIGAEEYDIRAIDEQTAIIVINSAGTLYGYILSDLDGTPALGSQQSLGSAVSGTGVAVEIRDASNAFLIKQTASTGLQTVALSISGATVSTGTVDTFLADASNTLYVRAVARYGTTDFYCVWYKDHTGGTWHAVAAEYDDGTDQFDSVGTPITLTASQCSIGAELRNVSDTCVVAVSRESSGGNDVFVRTITRAALVLTENSAASPDHTSHANTETPSVEMISSHCGVVCYTSVDASTARSRIQFFQVSQGTEDTVTMVDSALTLASNTYALFACLLTRNTLCGVYWSGTKFYTVPLTFNDNLDLAIGVMQTDAEDGNTEKVTFNGYEDNFSGLTAGTKYQIGYSGEPLDESTANGWPEGLIAESATEGIVLT